MTELSKQEAMEYLGVSDRTLERWVKKYKIAVRYENTEHGRQPFFDVAELERIKQERSPTHQPAIEKVDNSQDLEQLSQTAITDNLQTVAESLQKIADAAPKTAAYHELTTLLSKKSLTIREAAIISGLSVNFLKHQIRNGKLVGKKLGQSWRTTPQQLDIFMLNIFKEP